MDKKDYIKTLIVNEKEVKLGIDDAGQCYYIEYVNDDGETKETSLGSYNPYYMEEIYSLLDPIYADLSRKNMFETINELEKNILKQYEKKISEEYISVTNSLFK